MSASKSYAPHHEYIFSPRVFTELQNAQAIALPYDGLNPLPPQFCYLKPHYLDVQTSYFDHLARGRAMSSLDRILPFLQTHRGSALRSRRSPRSWSTTAADACSSSATARSKRCRIGRSRRGT